ncbi:permease YjgP/YjgQ family protein [Marinomonas mediterranea MMB-1]|uniref:Lipopolysaccharide export system permease protein LptF n=1 Tax=Marinomonas mediterranea (strain ATCC 700492 / JCM 21426 / NBRC 103028 / MMB-1) TaxID=717774 RepID=F2JV55_MARM1|nr:permease YjgP/YjgQ family protein [Marinomonas mediterranea MMB-1]
MRLFRYLAKEVLVSTAGVTLILLLIILSGRFVNYLGRAAEGKMSFEFLFIILGFHVPSFIQMILPLAFFLSLLLAYGRLYIENEMSILFSSGISKVKLTVYTLGIAGLLTLTSAFVNFWLSPYSEYQAELARQEQDQLTAFDFIQPGRFQGRGQQTTYVASFTPEEGWMNNIFLSDFVRKNGRDIPVQTIAKNAEQIRLETEGGLNYLIFKDGVRYEGTPGAANYRIMEFDTYAIRLEDKAPGTIDKAYAVPTTALFNSDNPKYIAELHWRIALVIMIPILAIIGVSLSQVNPRQGRFFKMLPAILLMIVYLGLLIWGKTALEKGKIPLHLGLWWAHGTFAIIAYLLFLQFNQTFSRKKAKIPTTKENI